MQVRERLYIAAKRQVITDTNSLDGKPTDFFKVQHLS